MAHIECLNRHDPPDEPEQDISGYQKLIIFGNVLTVFYLCGLITGDGVGSQEDQLCMALVSQLNKFADKETLIQFLRCFLLESNSSAVRWQAHCLALHIYRYCRYLTNPYIQDGLF